MLIPIKSLSLLLVMISSMFLLICNRFHATRAKSGKITILGAGFFEHRGSGLELLKSTFNAENFMCRLF